MHPLLVPVLEYAISAHIAKPFSHMSSDERRAVCDEFRIWIQSGNLEQIFQLAYAFNEQHSNKNNIDSHIRDLREQNVSESKWLFALDYIERKGSI